MKTYSIYNCLINYLKSWSDPCSNCGYHRADCECNNKTKSKNTSN